MTNNNRFKVEIEILKLLDHPNICKVYEYFFDNKFIFIATELCSGGSLYSHTIKQEKIAEEEACFYMYQVLSALAHIHAKGLIHRDIKPSNMLLRKLQNTVQFDNN